MKQKLSDKHIAFLDFGSFPGVVMFTVGFTYEEVLGISKKRYKDWVDAVKMMEDIYKEKNCGFASKRTVNGIKHFFLVLTANFDFSDESHTTLSHEAIHLISFQFELLGVDPIQENEAFCYTHTHILNQCYKTLRS